MGRRKKAAKKVVKKKRPTLSKTFKCLFCSNEKAVECKINITKSKMGSLTCTICKTHFERPINALSQPIDLYHAWLDETASLQEKESAAYLQQRRPDSGSYDLEDADAGDDNGDDDE